MLITGKMIWTIVVSANCSRLAMTGSTIEITASLVVLYEPRTSGDISLRHRWNFVEYRGQSVADSYWSGIRPSNLSVEYSVLAMERRQVLKSVGGVATAGLTSLAGCSSSNPSSGDDTDTTDSGASKGGTGPVKMVTEGSEYYFDPIGLFVESGTTVTWEIQSGSHSSTAYKKGNGAASVTRIPDGAKAWDSGVLTQQGATYEYTFETPGIYDYFCTPHKSLGMVARIVVDEPGGPAEGSMPPDGDVPESQTIVDQGAISYSEFSG